MIRTFRWFHLALAVVTVGFTLGGQFRASSAPLARPQPEPFATIDGVYGELQASPDGKRLACFDGESLQLVDLVARKRLELPRALRERTCGGGFCPAGLAVVIRPALVRNGGTVGVYDFERGQLKVIGSAHKSGVSCVARSDDGRWLATGTETNIDPDDDLLAVWDLKRMVKHRTLRFDSSVTSIAFTPNGSHVAAGLENGVLGVYSVSDMELAKRYERSSEKVRYIRFLSEDVLVAEWSHRRFTKRWYGWDSKSSYSGLVCLAPFDEPGHELILPKNGGVIASHPRKPHLLAIRGSIPDVKEANIQIWDAAKGKRLRAWKANTGTDAHVRFTPDGKTLLTVGLDKHLEFWNVAELLGERPE